MSGLSGAGVDAFTRWCLYGLLCKVERKSAYRTKQKRECKQAAGCDGEMCPLNKFEQKIDRNGQAFVLKSTNERRMVVKCMF